MIELNRKVRSRSLIQYTAWTKVMVFREGNVARIVFTGIPNTPTSWQYAVSKVTFLKQNSCEWLPRSAKIIYFSIVECLVYTSNISLIDDIPGGGVRGRSTGRCNTSWTYGTNIAFMEPCECILTKDEINSTDNERMRV